MVSQNPRFINKNENEVDVLIRKCKKDINEMCYRTLLYYNCYQCKINLTLNFEHTIMVLVDFL